MGSIFDLICLLSEVPFVSGKESVFHLPDIKMHQDSMGNLWWIQEGYDKNAKNILIEAHRDEVGLCVSDILENGFLTISSCGGLDFSILPGTEFVVHGTRKIKAIAASVPPHLASVGTKKEISKVEEIYLDTGLSSAKETKKYISVGDMATFSAVPKRLFGDKITCRSLDNKASIAALIHASKRMDNCKNNVMFLLSVGEETTSCGVQAFCHRFQPDIAIVVDAGFGYVEGMDETHCIQMGKGPSISYTDTLSLAATQWAVKTAEENDLPFQIIAEPGGTGTSATAIQKENGGIPSVVISIPVMNMHTPGEIVSEYDIKKTSELLSALVTSENLPEREVMIL